MNVKFIGITKSVLVGVFISVNDAIPVCVKFNRIGIENIYFMAVI